MTSHSMLRLNPVETWRSAVALWSEMAMAPSRVATAQARMTLRMMQATSPWRLNIAAGTVRTSPLGEVRAMATVLPLPTLVARPAAPMTAEVVEVVAEPVAAVEPAVEAVQERQSAAVEPVATEVAAPEAEHVPHGAPAEASPLAVAVATAEEALPAEALAAEPPEVPAPLAVLAEPAAETLEAAALEPILALAEGVRSAAATPQAKGRTAATPRKPRARRG